MKLLGGQRKSKQMSSRFDFFALPSELRRIVYHNVFEGANAFLNPSIFLESVTRSGRKIRPKRVGVSDVLAHVSENKAAILMAFPLSHKEASPILVSQMLLNCPYALSKFHDRNFLGLLEPELLNHIKTISMPIDTLLGVNLSVFHQLEDVVIAATMTAAPRYINHSWETSWIVQDYKAKVNDFDLFLLNRFWIELHDANSKRQRLIQLATEHGCQLKLLLIYRSDHVTDEKAEFLIFYDLETSEVFQRVLKLNGKDVLSNDRLFFV